MREEDHGVAGIEAMRPQNGLAVALTCMEKAILVRAHVSEHVMKEGDRSLHDRPEADRRSRARERLEGGEGAVPRAEGEDELIRLD